MSSPTPMTAQEAAEKLADKIALRWTGYPSDAPSVATMILRELHLAEMEAVIEAAKGYVYDAETVWPLRDALTALNEARK